MLQEIVAEIAVDFCADRFADVRKIDDANIDSPISRVADRERINFGQRNRNRAAGALTFL